MAHDSAPVACDVAIVAMSPVHWPAVQRIYTAGIATGHATFEDSPPTWEAFDADRLPEQRLVAVDGAGRVLGWAAASAVSDRCVYAGVVEHSVYVDPAAAGRGIGRLLLEALAESTEEAGTNKAGIEYFVAKPFTRDSFSGYQAFDDPATRARPRWGDYGAPAVVNATPRSSHAAAPASLGNWAWRWFSDASWSPTQSMWRVVRIGR